MGYYIVHAGIDNTNIRRGLRSSAGAIREVVKEWGVIREGLHVRELARAANAEAQGFRALPGSEEAVSQTEGDRLAFLRAELEAIDFDLGTTIDRIDRLNRAIADGEAAGTYGNGRARRNKGASRVGIPIEGDYSIARGVAS